MTTLNVLFLKGVTKIYVKINKQNHELIKINHNTLKKVCSLFNFTTFKEQVRNINLPDLAN